MSTSKILYRYWQAAWPDAPPGLAESVLEAWQTKGRHYHTHQHLIEMLEGLEANKHRAQYLDEIIMAIFFHDAVYNPKAHDNEARSAAWATEALSNGRWPDEAIGRITQMILKTIGHTQPETNDEALFLDLDLMILGTTPQRFSEYERQIRSEYRWVPGFIYRKERGKILKMFEAAQPLFHTEEIQKTHEKSAHRNLSKTLE